MAELLWAVWPWIGFGGGIVLAILLLGTNFLRSSLNVSRWHDPVWLAWVVVAVYLLHVLEEYGLHFENGQYTLIQMFIDTGVSARFGGIPMSFFPFVNIMLTWVAFPVAAIIARRNPIIGLSGIGFVLVNGLTHIVGLITLNGSMLESQGAVTGILVFIPLFIWIAYVCRKEHLLPARGLRIAVTSGILGHIGLFSIYLLNKAVGSTAVYFYIPVVAAMPIIVAWLLCKAYHVQVTDTAAKAKNI